MKKQSRRARAASMPTVPTRHQFQHEVPTVIHDPEEKMNTLARFTRRVLQSPGKFWFWVVVLVGVLAVLFVLNTTNVLRSSNTQVWSRLLAAKTADERINLAREYPNSPVGRWALLQAASDYYNLGVGNLPDNRDVAGQRFKKALELYEEVERQVDKDAFEARVAALGKGRTLEARNDLDKAIAQYDLVAKSWPGTAEGEEAKEHAAALRKPEATAFYKDLYSYTSTKFSLPSAGSESFLPPFSDLPRPAAGAGTSFTVPPSSTLNLELAPAPKAQSGAATLPANVFADSPGQQKKSAPSGANAAPKAPVSKPAAAPAPAPAPAEKRSQ
jgi:hypothetical protein